jgi:hypothetical protein
VSARRIQRKRTKDWRMPEGAVYVGRPTKWGNPFKVGEIIRRSDPLFAYVRDKVPGGVPADWHAITPLDLDVVLAAYFDWLVNHPELWLSIVPELRGRDLVCWCPLNERCHADILLKLAEVDALPDSPAEVTP